MASTLDPGAASNDDAINAVVDGDDDVEGDDAGPVDGDGDADEDAAARADSPLWMVSQSPALNELVAMLQRSRHALVDGGGTGTLRFSRAQVAQARAEFVAMIRRGERDLHRLAGLLADAVLGPHQLRSVVIGAIEESSERFTISVDVSADDVAGSTDLDLGNRVLARLAIADGRHWRRATLVSNVVEYEAQEPNRLNAYRILTRIKAEEEIWNKAVDEIFELDRMVLRDKQLRHLGRYVKDVFGIKIVVASRDDAYKAQQALAALVFDAEHLNRREVPADGEHASLRFIEVKDYMTRRSRKHSGWSAMKSVVQWGGRMFEIQVQPLSNFLLERERLTKESHASFKDTRDRVRDEVGSKVPLFSFYQRLLRWIFVEQSGDPPTHEGVEVVVVD
jgi:hypothetical protein